MVVGAGAGRGEQVAGVDVVEVAPAYDHAELTVNAAHRVVFEALADHVAAAAPRWTGFGLAIQSYQSRAREMIDAVAAVGRARGLRFMVRLVKGAYWDGEIKRAQLDGLEGYPVFTRRIHTDVSYLACARRLLAAPDAAFPQFGTHNALTLATLHTMAGENFYAGQYEFQYLHGMGEPLYDEVVGPTKLNRPCRVYTPVGTHETLLAYLVRRLLENGANTSFVNQIANPEITLETLLAHIQTQGNRWFQNIRGIGASKAARIIPSVVCSRLEIDSARVEATAWYFST